MRARGTAARLQGTFAWRRSHARTGPGVGWRGVGMCEILGENKDSCTDTTKGEEAARSDTRAPRTLYLRSSSSEMSVRFMLAVRFPARSTCGSALSKGESKVHEDKRVKKGICVKPCVFVCACDGDCVSVCVCICVCIHLCVYVYLCPHSPYSFTHTHTHTHTHTLSLSLSLSVPLQQQQTTTRRERRRRRLATLYGSLSSRCRAPIRR